MIDIPDDATPADVVGETNILPGQDWLYKWKILLFANMMQLGVFPWEQAHLEEPMSLFEAANGRVLNQGHHRWIAARLAGVAIPVKIEIRQDYRNGVVPFAIRWEQVVWRDEDVRAS